MKPSISHILLGLLLSFVCTLSAQVPGLITYQGRVAVGGGRLGWTWYQESKPGGRGWGWSAIA